MPALVVPGAALVRLIYNLNGAVGINVLGAVKPGGTVINQALANSMGAAIKSAFTGSGYAGHFSATGTLASVGVRDIGSANNPEYIDNGAAVGGTAVTDSLPGNVALCITLRTGKSGHSFQGRTYLPGWCEVDNNASGTGLPVVGTLGVAFVVGVQSAISGAGMTLAVCSRPAPATTTTHVVTNSDGTTTTRTRNTKARTGAITPVTSITARNTVWDSQRRRTSPGSLSTFFLQPAATYSVETGETWGTAVAPL